MLKKVSLYSVVAVSTLVLMGCTGTENGTVKSEKVVNNSKPAEVKGIKELFIQSKIKDIKNSGLKETLINAFNDQNIKNICKNGDMSLEVTLNEKLYTLIANNCSDEEITLNGEVSTKVDINTKTLKKGMITFNKNITLTDSENNILFKSGGEVNVDAKNSKGIWTNETVSEFQSTLNDVMFNVSGLKVMTTSDKIEVIEGKLNLGEYYFIIDNRKTNIMEIKDNKATGTIHMKDGAGHNIELVLKNNKISVNIDENADGTFSENEILK